MTEALCLMRWAYDICSSTVAAMAYLGKSFEACLQSKPAQVAAPVKGYQPLRELEALAHIPWLELRVFSQRDAGVFWDASWEDPAGMKST